MTIPFRVVLCAALVLAAPARQAALTSAQSCESLASLTLPDTTITLGQVVAAGAFVMPGAGGRSAQPTDVQKNLPAFCRVAATLRPTGDSEIKVEVWMPASGWNGKFQAVGNGGWAGSIGYAAMMDALTRGYATAGTDTGHSGGGAFALGHPEKLIDYAYRSEHEMAAKAKAVVAAFYGAAPKLSYWTGCSAGGKQGLMEAQRYPADFDGIVAGSPAADWTGRALSAIRVAAAAHIDEASYIPPAACPMIHAAVLQQCDAADGVKDGLLENPSTCAFDPGVLACKAGGDGANCLTAPQVTAARAIYASVVSAATKRTIPGLARGSELGWATWAGPQPLGIAYEHFRYVVFKDPAWDFHRFRADTDVPRADETDAGVLNALNPNLKPFFDRGGKLIQYHGWSDPQISPFSSVQYFRSVADRLGGAAKIEKSYRLFMVPGMGHCSGGEGPNSFDALGALEQWVEQKKAPERLIASRLRGGQVERTRPLCPFPQVAVHDGKGSIDDAASFSCRVGR